MLNTKSIQIKNMNKLFYKFIFVLISLFIYVPQILGQIKIDGYALNPKIGLYIWPNTDGGIIGGVEINILKGKFIYLADYYRFEELDFGSRTPDAYFNQVEIMFGKYISGDLFRFQFQGGLAPIWGLKRTNLVSEGQIDYPFGEEVYNSEEFFTLGIGTKVGFKLLVFEFMSIGFDIQTNLNIEKMMCMPMISIEFGKLNKNK
jgi:hypothetical protein